MFLDFISRALIAGMGIALVAGPLGSIIVWRRMANFGDTLAHSTLLGLCFALLFNFSLYLGLTGVCVIVASLLSVLSRQKTLGHEAILSILAYATLAIGLILAAVIKGVRIDLLSYLYGDILAVSGVDILWIYGVDLVVFLILAFVWNPILSVTVHRDLAQIEGVSPQGIQWIVVMLMAFVFAVAMKLVGILLITALLILPACTARQWSHSPEQMAVSASILGMISIGLGIGASAYWDWPTGPAIVVVMTVLFFLSWIGSHLKPQTN